MNCIYLYCSYSDTFYVYLQTLLSRLSSEQCHLESDMKEGRALVQQEHSPEFVQETVNRLENKVKLTTQLANDRYRILKVR